MTQRAVVLDTETTGITNPQLIEAAYVYVDEQGTPDLNSLYEQRFNPGTPSEWGAIGVHHIFDFELEGKPAPDTFSLPNDVTYVIGHNIGFDLNVLGLADKVRAIDLYPLSKKAFPELDNHKQVTLFYYLNRESPQRLMQAREQVARAHSAGADILMCAHNLQKIIAWSDQYAPVLQELGMDNNSVFERLHLISQAARYPMVMPFGKHKGAKPWELPKDYIQWYSRLDNFDPVILNAMLRNTREQSKEELAVIELAEALFNDAAYEEPFALKPVVARPRF